MFLRNISLGSRETTVNQSATTPAPLELDFSVIIKCLLGSCCLLDLSCASGNNEKGLYSHGLYSLWGKEKLSN